MSHASNLMGFDIFGNILRNFRIIKIITLTIVSVNKN